MDAEYQKYSQSSGGQSFDTQDELRLTTFTTIEADIVRSFGTESQFGASLGVVFENPVLVDGGLYVDPEKGVYKGFSWTEITGFSPAEAHEEGNDPEASDAVDPLPKTYGDTQKRYRLVASRVPELTDDDGEVVVEASSQYRDHEAGGGDFEAGEFTDLGGEAVELQDFIMWNSGTEENGPSVSSQRLAEVLTTLGSNAVRDEDNIYEWLNDTTGENILRDELEGRRVRFFIVRRPGQDGGYAYNYPVLIDVKTGEEISVSNASSEGDSGN